MTPNLATALKLIVYLFICPFSARQQQLIVQQPTNWIQSSAPPQSTFPFFLPIIFYGNMIQTLGLRNSKIIIQPKAQHLKNILEPSWLQLKILSLQKTVTFYTKIQRRKKK